MSDVAFMRFESEVPVMSDLTEKLRRLADETERNDPLAEPLNYMSAILFACCLADEHEALEQVRREREKRGDQRTCMEQMHGDSHAYCGKCSICLEIKALAATERALSALGEVGQNELRASTTDSRRTTEQR